MKCDKNCLECSRKECIHDVEDRNRLISDIIKGKESARHSEYYRKHREEILKKQAEYDKNNRNAVRCHEYYLRHKEEINEKHRLRYQKDRERRLAKAKEYYEAHKEEISKRRKEKRCLQQKKESALS